MTPENDKRVYVAGTFDTKHDELQYMARSLARLGMRVATVDLGTSDRVTASKIDYSAAEVAACHPQGATAVLGVEDRGDAVAAMAESFRRFLHSRDDVAGVIGAGGSGGTSMLAPAFRSLPIGTPKLIVSTVASGNVAPYVGASDLTMMYSVTDVEGLNRISRQILGNAAHAMAGMVMHAADIGATEQRPAIGLTMFGVTTPCVKAVMARLKDTYDCLVFHATGTGGASMEKLAESGLLTAVLDLTTTEIADRLVGGVMAAGEDRLGAIIRSKCPYIGSLGALDMVNFGARETVPAEFADRLFHSHNPQVTLMRTSVDENRAIGRWIAERLNQMHGDVRFLIPEMGLSMLDTRGQPFHDPQADAALFDTLDDLVVRTDRRRLIRVPASINDALFSDTVVDQFTQLVPSSR